MRRRSQKSDSGLNILDAAPAVAGEVEAAPRSSKWRARGNGFRDWWQGTKFRKSIAAGIAVVLCATLALVYVSTASSANSQYQLANAVRTDVTQELTQSGTLTPQSSANVTFPTSGTVARVYVRSGQKVKAGQKLAQLDTTQLQAKVTQARSQLAQAELSLYNLENGVAGSGSGSGSGSANNTSATSSSNISTRSDANAGVSGSKANKQLQALQAELTKALATSTRELAASQAACVAAPASADESGSSAAPVQSTTEGCSKAQRALMQTQTRIAQLQQHVGSTLTQLSKSNSSTPAQNQSGSAGGQSTTSVAATDEQIAAAQASVASAQANVAAAKQNLAAATITAPMSGTVLAMPLKKGQPASTSDAVAISGSKQYQATVSVDVSKIAQVKPGQDARVTPSGSAQILDGVVSTVGAAPVTNSSTVTYPVTIAVSGAQNDLRSGSTASVIIVTAAATDVVAVPTSALRNTNGNKSVQVLREGLATRLPVTTGAVGATYTEILTGLNVGDQVVLADLAEPMPTSGATNRFRGGVAGSGFPGAMPTGMTAGR